MTLKDLISKKTLKDYLVEIETETQKITIEEIKKSFLEAASLLFDSKFSNFPIPKDGEDYVLTEEDKKEIASKIKVPVVEKVIEKTEVIREQPIVKEIVKNEIREVAKDIPGEEIVNKINSLPIGMRDARYKIRAEHIIGLPESGKQIHGGGMSTSLFISGETVSGSGTSWTLAYTPDLFIGLYAQGQKLSTARGDYTISGKTITTVNSWSAGDIEADYYRKA